MKHIAPGVIIVLVLIMAVYLIFIKDISKNSTSYKVGNISDYSIHLDREIPARGYIPDAETARKTADTILHSIYGNEINNEKPFIVRFDEKNQVWIVEGQLPHNQLGGTAYIVIRKKDGKVLSVWHTK
ncbi:MAG: NTF2 fold immunity protein [Bacillota bacterium]|nr:NTF2 fold immunity protein [Bacillota bacterium]